MRVQFARVFSDIIVEEFGQKISCVAVINWLDDKHPHILVITNSDEETVPEETKEAIINTARAVSTVFGIKHHVVTCIRTMSDIGSYTSFHRWPPLDEECSFVALINIQTHRGGVRELHAFRMPSGPVLYDDGIFETLLEKARSRH